MAHISLQAHNLQALAASGQTTIPITLDEGCVLVDAYASGGTLTPREVRLSGSNLILGWNANTSLAAVGTVIVVKGTDGQGNAVYDYLALNQAGRQYSLSVTGTRDVEGNNGSVTYSISSNIDAGYNVVSQSPWLTVKSVTKVGGNSGNAIIAFPNNNGDPRSGVIMFEMTFQDNPYRSVCYVVITQGIYVPRTSTISYNPNSAKVNYAAGVHTSPRAITENVSSLTVRNVTGTMDIQSVDIDSNGTLVIRYGANPTDGQLYANISVRGTGVSGFVSTTYTLYQGSSVYLVNPIWKTTTVDVAGSSYIDYTVSTEGLTVYSGRAYQMPDSDNISFELNEIVRDYVDNYLWWREGYQTPSGWQRSFTVDMSNGSGGEYIFTKDWSYKEMNYSTSNFICLNEPIINEIPAGCFVPVCVFSPQKAGNTSFTRNGTPVYTANLDNPRQARYLFVSAPGYNYGYSGDNYIYKGVAACQTRYVLYYENAYGGIDAMPVLGNATLTDKITAYTTKNQVRVPSTSFSYRRYLNEIQKTWEFKTGFLSDGQASRMHHLFESTMVYVYDMRTDTLYPVVIDENSLEYKTYRNQGRKFFNYSFKVRESQDKIRK